MKKMNQFLILQNRWKTAMMGIGAIIFGLALSIVSGCNGNAGSSSATITSQDRKANDFYFDFSIDGKPFQLDTTAILTSYNAFSATDHEFKIFAGKDDGPNLVLTIIAELDKASSTANGSTEAGSKLGQGSVSLQNYPEKGLVFNSYDYLLNPKPTVIPDAIVISSSEKLGKTSRILTGTINVTVRGGENKQHDSSIKEHVIKGKFKIKHDFKGQAF